MRKPHRMDAIIALVGPEVNGTLDGSEVNYLAGQTPPSESAIDTKLIELKVEYDAQEYARNRKPKYPDIGDQLDDLYHKGAFSDEMAVKIKAVKDAHPKPE